MKTTIWLKSQPKKKIEYPDCYPHFIMPRPQLRPNLDTVWIKDLEDKIHSTYAEITISRIEYRP